MDELEYMRKHMHQMGDELYEKSKMLQKRKPRLLSSKMKLRFGNREQKLGVGVSFFKIIIGVGVNFVSLMLGKIVCMVNIS